MIPNTFEVFKSTVLTLVIPPFLAAVWMLASAPKHSAPRKHVPEAWPTLDPIAVPEADTGFVKLHDAKTVTAMIADKKTFFIKEILVNE